MKVIPTNTPGLRYYTIYGDYELVEKIEPSDGTESILKIKHLDAPEQVDLFTLDSFLPDILDWGPR